MYFLILLLENISFNKPLLIKNIKSFLTNANKTDIKHLGRWDITYDKKVINKKIDFSNYDHCGTCGIEKIEIQNDKALNDIKKKNI